MDIEKALGTDFDSLGFDPAASTEEYRTWLVEEGERPDYAVEFKDGSLSFLLDEDRKVTTVFLMGAGYIEQALGVPSVGGFPHVVERLGAPTSTGSEKNVPILGTKGAWLRYELPTHVMHIECGVGTEDIRMVTLMMRRAIT